MTKIGSNISSLTIQRHLSAASTNLSNTFERLSSGQRINKASDDAAGLAIAMSLNSNSRVFTQGIRNLNDGVSLLNIAEAATGELTGILTRIIELAEQGANGTFSSQQRDTIQSEVTALQKEYNRIIGSTTFNGLQVLQPEHSQVTLQGGYGTADQLALQVGSKAKSGYSDYSAGEARLVSVSSSGAAGNATSSGTGAFISISGDGRYIAFKTNATNFASGDTNGAPDIFVKDTISGALTLVSASSSGGVGNTGSHAPVISGDGRFALFQTSSSNIVAGDTNTVGDIFVRDLANATTERVSLSNSGAEGDAVSTRGSLSADGRYVAFVSSATNLVAGDTNGSDDIFLRDRVAGTTTLVSNSSSGVLGNGAANIAQASSISANGRYVVFASTASNLVAGDTNGASDIFVRDVANGTTSLVSSNSSGVVGNAASASASISADGRYVVFMSAATDLVAGDTNASQDIFMKDLWTGETRRVSTDSNNAQSDAGGALASISADGRYVAFYSGSTNLVADDTNGGFDVFVKDTMTNSTRLVSRGSSGVLGDAASDLSAISADGRFVAFESDATNLDPNDTNGLGDIFIRDMARAGVQELAGMLVTDQASSRVTLDLAKRYLDEVSSYRATIGAGTSRASTFIRSLQAKDINVRGASARIMDADVASEAASVAALSIIQQMGAQVLAQANQSPALALRLLSNG